MVGAAVKVEAVWVDPATGATGATDVAFIRVASGGSKWPNSPTGMPTPNQWLACACLEVDASTLSKGVKYQRKADIQERLSKLDFPSSLGEVHPPPATAPGSVLKGSVTSRERIALPPDTVIDLWIVDATPGIVIAAIFAEASVPTAGRQVPIPFELRYGPARVAADHDYQIKAVIRAGGRTVFETQEKYPVITKGAPRELELAKVATP